jgi:hypothetical protein
MRLLDSISWVTVGLICATLGLAPFVPEPHIWEKLRLLVAGNLVRPIDIFDMVFHGAPWAVAALKAVRELRRQ